LQKLHKLPDHLASKLLADIKSAASEKLSEMLAGSDLPKISGLSPTDERDILDTLLSLYRVRAIADVSIEEFLQDVCEFLQSPSSKEFHLPKADVGEFAERLKKFLSVEALSRAAKATILRYEHERTLCSVRILTDVRPVFEDAKINRPDTAVIFHMLKLAYHESDEVREMFISLDENDLEALKQATLRAELKYKSLKDMLTAAAIKVIELT